MISFHFRCWRAYNTRTRTTVAVVVSRAINKRETIAAVHIRSHKHAPKSSTFYDLLLHLVRYCIQLYTTYLYVLLFFLETRPKPNGPAKKRVRYSGDLSRWNAIKYRSPGPGRTSADSVDFRKNPRRAAARRTKIKTEIIQNVTWAPHCARATKPSRVATRSYLARATDAKTNAHTATADGVRRRLTTDGQR